MNPVTLAIIVSMLLGVAMVPWNHALKHMASSQFLMMLGATFLTVGATMKYVQKQAFTYEHVALTLAIAAITPYVSAICFTSPMYERTTPKVFNIVAAILAAFAVPAMLVNTMIFRTLPSMTELLFIVITIIGVVGLSLVSK